MSEGEIGTAELGVTPPPETKAQTSSAEVQTPVNTGAKEPLAQPAEVKEPSVTLAKTRRILEEMGREVEDLKKDTKRAQELGMTKGDLEREAARIQEALSGLEKDPEKAKSYLLGVYQQRAVLIGNVENIVNDPEGAKENLRQQGMGQFAEQILPEEEKGVEVKVEEAEVEAKVTEGARMIRDVLKNLGVSEKELAGIDGLINQPAGQQINAIIKAQRELGREDYADHLKTLQGDKEKILAELKEQVVSQGGTKEKLTKAKLFSIAKYGGIGVVLLVMLLFQLEQKQEI